MLVELSYVLSETAPKWPTNPEEKYYDISSTKNGDLNNASSVYHHMHNGTHFDAPRHFDPNGQTMEQLPVEDFYYEHPFVLKLDKKKGECVLLEDLLAHEAEILECDILLIYTGHSKYRAERPLDYQDNFPYISPEAAVYMRKQLPGLKAIALDTISVDSSVHGVELNFPSHHALLETSERYPERTLRIFEDVNVQAVLDYPKIQSICALPVRWSGLEAGPVGILAVI